MDDIIKNYKDLKIQRTEKENKIKNETYLDSENSVSIAIAINDVVVDVVNVHESFSEMIINDAKLIVLPKNEKTPMVGWQYFDGKFISFEEYINLFPITLRG